MVQAFGNTSYGLHNLFTEERHRIMCLLTQETLTRLDQLYSQVYRDNYGILMAFQRDNLSVPQELKVAAEVALSHRALTCLKGLEQEMSDLANASPKLGASYLGDLEAIAAEANHLGCQLNLTQARETLESLILRLLWQLLHDLEPDMLEISTQRLQRLLELGQHLHLNLRLERAQELYLHGFHEQILPQWIKGLHSNGHSGATTSATTSAQMSTSFLLQNRGLTTGCNLSLAQLHQLIQVGQNLAIDVSPWLNSCSYTNL
jgi:hypothetical protein